MPFPGLGWSGLEDPVGYEEARRFTATQDRSPALRARRLTLDEELTDGLVGVLATELGRAPGDTAIRALAARFVATPSLRDRVLRAAVARRAAPGVVRREVTAAVDEAFSRLEAAFGDMDRPSGPGQR